MQICFFLPERINAVAEAIAGKVPPPPVQLRNGINAKQGINDNELLLGFSL